MYREMTPEEKLEYSAKIIEAVTKEGFTGALKVVEEYKKILSMDIPAKKSEVKMSVAIEEDNIGANSQNITQQENKTIQTETPMEASIYDSEHIAAVQEDLREHSTSNSEEIVQNEQPKTRTLEPTKSFAPKPWGESKVVLPGELNLK